MRKELEKKLIEEFPSYFREMYGDKRITCMHYGCTCSEGWFDLIYNLCEEIKSFEDEETDFHFKQIKEKFGILTIYAKYENNKDKIFHLIIDAQKKSEGICEVCGSTENVETLARPFWIRTLCKKCEKK